jgi:hypothetical protein
MTMAICGVFLAVPPRVFGARLRTGDDLAQFVAGTHPIVAADRLEISDAWACLAELCERCDLHGLMGLQPVAVPGTLATGFVPAYRLPALADRIEQVAPARLAAAMDALSLAPPADGAAWAGDKRALALHFLRLKQLYRRSADSGCDLLFVRHTGTPAQRPAAPQGLTTPA